MTQIAIEAEKYFNNNKRTFSKHGESIIIEQLSNKKTTPTEKLKLRWRKKENFWIKISKHWYNMT